MRPLTTIKILSEMYRHLLSVLMLFVCGTNYQKWYRPYEIPHVPSNPSDFMKIVDKLFPILTFSTESLRIMEIGSGVGSNLFLMSKILQHRLNVKDIRYVGIERIPKLNDIADKLMSNEQYARLIDLNPENSSKPFFKEVVDNEIGDTCSAIHRVIVVVNRLFIDTKRQKQLEKDVFEVFPTETIFLFTYNSVLYPSIETGIGILVDQPSKGEEKIFKKALKKITYNEK